MALLTRSVDAAIDRWESVGFVSHDTAEALRQESQEARRLLARRLGQWFVAALGAFALVAAAVLFADRNWEDLTEGARTVIVGVGGAAAYAVGLLVRNRYRLRPTGNLIQFAGLSVVLASLIYSMNAWADGTAGAVIVGLIAVVVPAVTAPVALRQGEATTGMHVVLLLLYLAVAMDRGLGMEMDGIVWVLDAVLLVVIIGVWFGIRRWPVQHRERALVTLGVSFWAGLVLAFFTGVGPLDLSDQALYATDVWAALMLGVTLWGIHGAPEEYRREAYQAQLAAMIFVAGLLWMFTAAEVWNMDADGFALMGAIWGAAGLVYGLRFGNTQALSLSALPALIGIWVFAVESAGAVGGIVALLISAGMLFWVSARIRTESGSPSEAEVPPEA